MATQHAINGKAFSNNSIPMRTGFTLPNPISVPLFLCVSYSFFLRVLCDLCGLPPRSARPVP